MKTKTIIIGITAFLFSFTYAFSQAPVMQWDAAFGGNQNEQLYSTQQTTDGGFIIGGYSDSGPSGTDYYIVKTDANGVKLWDARYGGTSVDQLTALQQTADGGFILGGISFSGISGDKTQPSQGKSDYWIVKTDANGVKQWDARFGGHNYDELHSLQQTTDGGYILGGFSMSGIGGDQTQTGKGGKDYWIVKTDGNGVKQWDARFGGNKFEELYSIRQTTDGGYLLGGYSLSDISGDKTQPTQGGFDYWIVKTDDQGVKQWDARFGGISDDWLTDLKQTTDGGYILGGWSWSGLSGDKTQISQGDNDYWIIKINSNGVKQWDADFGGSSNDYLNPIQQTIDGGYILGGYSSSPVSGDKTQASLGGTDYWIVKTDVNGVKQWDAQFGGSDFDFLYALDQTTDGGYILGGSSSSGISGDKTQAGNGFNDYWIVKTDAAGVSCNIPVNLSAVNVNSASATLKWDTVNGAIKYKVSYRIDGTSEWTTVNANSTQKTLNGLLANTEYSWKVKSVCSQQPAIASDWSAKQSFTTNPLRLEAAIPLAMVEVYPNPVLQTATVSFLLEVGSRVSIELVDMDGRSTNIITEEEFSAGSNKVTFNRGSLAAGIYFLHIKTEAGVIIRKLVID